MYICIQVFKCSGYHTCHRSGNANNTKNKFKEQIQNAQGRLNGPTQVNGLTFVGQIMPQKHVHGRRRHASNTTCNTCNYNICKQMATLQNRQTHTCKCLLLGIVQLIFLAKQQAKFTNLQSKAQAAIVAALDGICVLGGAYNRNANFAFCWQATQTSVLYIC